MKSGKKIPVTIDEYLIALPETDRAALQKIRAAVLKSVPKAEECISYGMPTMKYFGVVMHFASFTHHYSIFVRPGFKEAFVDELAAYSQTKAAVHFPKEKNIPVGLIRKLAAFISRENLRLDEIKKAAKTNRGARKNRK